MHTLRRAVVSSAEKTAERNGGREPESLAQRNDGFCRNVCESCVCLCVCLCVPVLCVHCVCRVQALCVHVACLGGVHMYLIAARDAHRRGSQRREGRRERWPLRWLPPAVGRISREVAASARVSHESTAGRGMGARGRREDERERGGDGQQ